MVTKKGYLQHKKTGDTLAPKTLSSLVKDEARNQALSASLATLVEKNALGYPSFSTLTSYAVGETVFYDRRLHTFTKAHAPGAWIGTDVEETNIKELIYINPTVIAEALLYLYHENNALRLLLTGKDNAVLPYIKAQTVECEDMLAMGVPMVLTSKVAGAPGAANVPDNWDNDTMTVWNGCPYKVGQLYVDQASNKVYCATKVTGSTNDWVVLN